MSQRLVWDADVRVGPSNTGTGLFAARTFAAGERILLLHGLRFEREDPIHLTDKGANLLQTGRRTYILLEPPGVYANHSCDPNAGIAGNRALVALRDIPAGEEIRFDYSTTMDEDFWTMECRCGAATCRGVVGDFKTLPPEVQARYLERGVVQGFIARRARAAGGV